MFRKAKLLHLIGDFLETRRCLADAEALMISSHGAEHPLVKTIATTMQQVLAEIALARNALG
jgi:hypothetical protein